LLVAFEWVPRKNELNIIKHGIDFEDAAEVFEGAYLERVDDRFYYGEQRLVAFGEMGPQVIAVVYVWRGERRRLVSARRATRVERKAFFEVIHGKK
jgi:uncharacterized DUF497 family protein